ncbi:FAD-binding and (Fe-S)-binding domain-containing protein [Herbiconiux sp. P17]|uniref:FAD-binding and (Fe-S)-binding domain-containing protein n=1 Tax=Herbiconiux wuyangfengii TaxID=3342794 RepID=UPI0035B938A3
MITRVSSDTIDDRDLHEALTSAGIDDIDASERRRSEFSSDASNYRVRPRVVVGPRDADEVAAVIGVARETGVPITARGGGTSVAGNAIGPGIVLDFTRHMTALGAIDPDGRTADLEPGLVLGALQRASAPHGLRFGPDPSTWARCTVGGMIGNNACGPHALAYGRTADNIESLDVIDGRGRRLRLATGLEPVPGLDRLVDDSLALVRTELGRFGRQISGYSLEHLLPERGRHLARAFAGTEGTLGVVVGARMRLVPIEPEPALVVLGYPDMAAAADAVPAIIGHGALAIEGLDARLVDVVRRQGGAVPALPEGAGWLMVEVGQGQGGDVMDRARAIVADAGAFDARVMPSGSEARALWRIREDGAGLAGRTAAGRQAWPGLEDAAVPPENLGRYLRDFERLLARYDIHGVPYGHFGDGCVHVRLDIPLDHDGSTLSSFMEDAASLIASHGGSLSGEHGDGRARSSLLPRMYSAEMIRLFGRVKGMFDPDDILNPGIIVRPAPVDTDLRRPLALSLKAADGFGFLHDGGDMTNAMHRCVGVGKCRVDNTASGGFMCPSFLATGDEKDSTRGRARVLQEAVSGVRKPDWSSQELTDSLDLCLSCKACSTDCPAGVDMAALKSETLHRRYRGRVRPMSHYTLGWLPRWARLATRAARVVNAIISVRPLERIILRAGGMDARRAIPRFAETPFRRSKAHGSGAGRAAGGRPRVVLWADSFTDNFSPLIAESTFAVLDAAGFDVLIPSDSACCGLTWITTGQLAGARRRLGHLLDVLHPFVAEGIPVLGLEPSCTAVLRSDLRELLPEDPRAAEVSAATVTLSELLTGPLGDAGWSAPGLDGLEVVVQPHCHQHSVMGFAADRALLERSGARVTELAGCCGLAGNFGMEKGHYEVSVAVAGNALLSALSAAPAGAVFLADGLSCRTQADHLAGVHGRHLAELLAAAAAGNPRSVD